MSTITEQSPNVAAVLETAKAQVTITTLPIPQPGPEEVLVRNYAIAANPCDWKVQTYGIFVTKYPMVLGSDIAGIITAIGSSVTKFKVGDRVTGFAAMIYNGEISHGAWQTYTLLRSIATSKIPPHMSFIEGSVLPLAFATAACSLYIDLQISRPLISPIHPLDPLHEAGERTEGFLVWGGGSSVGSAVVQLAKNSGFKVFVTASKKHEGWLKAVGAYKVFDYHDIGVVGNIVEAARKAGTVIKMGVDAVTEGDSARMAVDVLVGSGGGGKLVTTIPWPGSIEKLKTVRIGSDAVYKEDVTKLAVNVPEGIEILNGGAFRMFTVQAELGEWFFNDYLQVALENGSVVPAPPVEVVEGGIEATQKAWELLKKGVSGKKLVVEAK